MIITKKINIMVNKNNIEHYKSKGYNIPTDRKITIDTEDIHYNVNTKINMQCDICKKEFTTIASTYINRYKNNNKHACTKCRHEYAEEKYKKEKWIKRKIHKEEFDKLFKQV